MMAGGARFTFNYTVRGAPEACTYAMLGLMWSSDHRHLAIVGISKFSCTGLMKNCISALSLALSKFIFLLGRRAIFFALLRWCNNIDINNFIAVKAICCQHFFSSSHYCSFQRLLHKSVSTLCLMVVLWFHNQMQFRVSSSSATKKLQSKTTNSCHRKKQALESL